MNFTKKNLCKNSDGQLLIELLVSLLVGGVLMIGATLAVVSLLRYNFESRTSQVTALQNSDLMNFIDPIMQSNWHTIYDLAKGTSTPYYIAAGTSSSVIVSGEESMLVDDVGAGLVAHWKLDEATSTTGYDSSGYSRHGTLTNGPSRVASSSCQVGPCVLFDDTKNTYMSVPYYIFSDAEPWTFTHWIKWTGQNDVYVFYAGSGSSLRNFLIRYGSNNRFSFRSNTTGYALFAVNSSDSLVGNWAHVTWVADGTGKLAVYVNGTLSEQLTGIGTSMYMQFLGKGYTSRDYATYPDDTYYLKGALDDVRVYNRALSANEIKQLYESQVNIRHFHVEDVYRDASDNVTSTPTGNTLDPSTQKITTAIVTAEGKTIEYSQYMTRSMMRLFQQTDWMSGYGVEGPVTSSPTGFATSSSIQYALTPSLTLNGTTTSGWLESTTYDTQVTGGAALHNVQWQGTLPSGTTVKFQFAGSATSTGPWSYVGSDGTNSTYFTPSAPNVSVKITNMNNYRYFRYKVFLTPDSGNVPTVDDIYINWTQ